MIVAFRQAEIDRHVAAFDKAGFVQALVEGAQTAGAGSATPAVRKPITGIAGCCARAASGHARRAAKQLMNSRRFIRSPRRRVRAGRRHIKAERLGSLEVDHELELGRLLRPAGRQALRPRGCDRRSRGLTERFAQDSRP